MCSVCSGFFGGNIFNVVLITDVARPDDYEQSPRWPMRWATLAVAWYSPLNVTMVLTSPATFGFVPMPPARLLITAVFTASFRSLSPVDAPPELIRPARPM